MADDVFEERYAELAETARRAAYRILGDRHAAEDIAAETMTRAWTKWPTLVTGSPAGWVSTVAVNLALDALRAGPRRSELDDEVPSPAGDPALREALGAALDALPARQREVIVLRHVVGLTAEETAKALGIARATTSVHLHRGQKAMRDELEAGAISPATKRERPTMKINDIEAARAALKAGSVLTAKATAVVKGGLSVDIGIPAHLPASFVDIATLDDLTGFVGRQLDVIVVGIGKDEMPIVSRRAAIEGPEDKQRRRATLERLEVGQRVAATVTQQLPFGVFVDLGSGVRGLAHVSTLPDPPPEVGSQLDVIVDAVQVAEERVSVTLA